MKIIAFDVMGNDNGVEGAVASALKFVKENKDYSVILVGDKNQITPLVPADSRGISIEHSANEVKGELGARAARDADNSMALAIKLVKDQKAGAVISSGNSGAYLSLSTLILKRIDGVKRPAFMPIFPTVEKNKKFLLLDAGANLEVTSEMLEQWATIASVFSETVLKVKDPIVKLINIGVEDEKGLAITREAHQNLQKNKSVNYKGFIEPRDLLLGETDVAVVDGYGGNLILKTMEGTSMSLLRFLKKTLLSKLKWKIGALISRGGFQKVKDQLDYRNVGAAWVIGLQGLVVKSHGNSDEQAFTGTFNQVKTAIEANALEHFTSVVTGGK